MSAVAQVRPWRAMAKPAGTAGPGERITGTAAQEPASPTYPTGPSNIAQIVRRQIAQVARFDTTVLVLGESGTGKELVARQIHSLSARSQGPFLPVNCGAIPPDLLESELFGHERGAFTGAVGTRQGRFELAEGGTLFLDEIGEMSPHMQVKLLRVLQQKTFERVGSCEPRTADVRIVAATHRDLEAEVRAGRFREDLFFRLNVVPITLPALRARIDDLPHLIEGFHTELEMRGHIPARLSSCALQALRAYEWPGNVRELQNLLERLSVMQPGQHVAASQLPERYQGAATGVESLPLPLGCADGASEERRTGFRLDLPEDGIGLKELLTNIERELIQQALARSSGVVSQAARLLGLGRTTLLEKIRKFHLT